MINCHRLRLICTQIHCLPRLIDCVASQGGVWAHLTAWLGKTCVYKLLYILKTCVYKLLYTLTGFFYEPAGRRPVSVTTKFSREPPELFFALASSFQRAKTITELPLDCHSHVSAHIVPMNLWLFSCCSLLLGILKWPVTENQPSHFLLSPQ